MLDYLTLLSQIFRKDLHGDKLSTNAKFESHELQNFSSAADWLRDCELILNLRANSGIRDKLQI